MLILQSTINPDVIYPTLEQLFSSMVVRTAFASGLGSYIYYMRSTITNRLSVIDYSQIYASILTMLQNHVDKIGLLCTQVSNSIPLESIANIPYGHAIHIIGFMGPLLETHEIMFYFLTRMVNFLEFSESVHFEAFDSLYETMREQGNYLFEIYRALESHVGIPISESRIALQDFET